MEIISSQSFLHENFLMARCLPMRHLEQGNRKKGAFRGLTVFESSGPGYFTGKTGGKRSDVVQ